MAAAGEPRGEPRSLPKSEELSVGPLKAFLPRLANMTPLGGPSPKAVSLNLLLGMGASSLIDAGGFRVKRPKLLVVPVVGVAGSTLIDACGDRPTDRLPGDWTVSIEFEEREEALLCVACLGRLLTLDIDELVLFLPLSPTPPLLLL